MHYGLVGHLKMLPSYIDKNYLFTTLSQGKENQFVVKIPAQSTPLAEIECENAAMNHVELQKLTINTPIILRSLNNQQLLDFTWPNGITSKFRMVSFLPGKLYSQVDTEEANLHQSLGQLVAQATKAFKDFKYPSAHRQFNWDIAQLMSLEANLDYYHDKQREQISRHLQAFKFTTLPALQLLPKQVIHNDLNDNNLIAEIVDGKLECTGFFDFGDIVYTHRLCDLAIAMAYALMSQQNFLTTAQAIVQGYQATLELNHDELNLLPKLIVARLLQSLLNSGKSFADQPDNTYLLVSAKPAWNLLDKFEALKPNEFINAITALNH